MRSILFYFFFRKSRGRTDSFGERKQSYEKEGYRAGSPEPVVCQSRVCPATVAQRGWTCFCNAPLRRFRDDKEIPARGDVLLHELQKRRPGTCREQLPVPYLRCLRHPFLAAAPLTRGGRCVSSSLL